MNQNNSQATKVFIKKISKGGHYISFNIGFLLHVFNLKIPIILCAHSHLGIVLLEACCFKG